jgi:hypothetical protein
MSFTAAKLLVTVKQAKTAALSDKEMHFAGLSIRRLASNIIAGSY